jgi:hypothetical protein
MEFGQVNGGNGSYRSSGGLQPFGDGTGIPIVPEAVKRLWDPPNTMQAQPGWCSVPSLAGITSSPPRGPGGAPPQTARLGASHAPQTLAATEPVGAAIFFAGATPVTTADTLAALFEQFGTLVKLTVYKPWAGSKTSKVRRCGRMETGWYILPGAGGAWGWGPGTRFGAACTL